MHARLRACSSLQQLSTCLPPAPPPPLQVVLLVDMAALLLYNYCGMMVTGHLGAVFRTVLETTRTLFVWLIDIVLFYSLDGAPRRAAPLGCPWTRPPSQADCIMPALRLLRFWGLG
jgi:hypothetical protein